MIDNGDSQDQDPWVGADDPQTIAAIGAEFDRIVGSLTSSEPDPFGGNWGLPIASLDEMLELLRAMPSDISMAEFAARLRDRFGSPPTLKGVPPEQRSEDGA